MADLVMGVMVFIIIGIVASGIISWVVGLACLAGTLIFLKKKAGKK